MLQTPLTTDQSTQKKSRRLLSLLSGILVLAVLAGALLFSVTAKNSGAHAAVSPAISRVSCTGNGYNFVIYTNYGGYIDCFGGTGSLKVALYDVTYVTIGNITATLTWDDGHNHFHQWNLLHKSTYYFPNGKAGDTIYRVDTIRIV